MLGRVGLAAYMVYPTHSISFLMSFYYVYEILSYTTPRTGRFKPRPITRRFWFSMVEIKSSVRLAVCTGSFIGVEIFSGIKAEPKLAFGLM